jgi:hypothetical protein
MWWRGCDVWHHEDEQVDTGRKQAAMRRRAIKAKLL